MGLVRWKKRGEIEGLGNLGKEIDCFGVVNGVRVCDGEYCGSVILLFYFYWRLVFGYVVFMF